MLPPELRRKADREAKALGISLSELIRRKLGEGGEEGVRTTSRFIAREPWKGDGPADTAANHDDYLYGP